MMTLLIISGEGFTDISQYGQCYLPDKEFRYLRTVIVTAAVYRGFSSQLRTLRH